jgi:hypothetical protein
LPPLSSSPPLAPHAPSDGGDGIDGYADEYADLFVEEPRDAAPALDAGDSPDAPAPAPDAAPPPQLRFHVTVSGLFGYDVYLRGTEGAQLTIGCARDNDIVLPHTESRRHVLRLYCSQGSVWIEDRGSTQQASIDGIPLKGTRCLVPGAAIEVGSAQIVLLDTQFLLQFTPRCHPEPAEGSAAAKQPTAGRSVFRPQSTACAVEDPSTGSG